MQMYKTIYKIGGGYHIEPIDKAYITACNGWTAYITHDNNYWNITEAITGLSLNCNKTFKTLKQARQFIDELITDRGNDSILRMIEYQSEYIKNHGLTLPNSK